MSEFESAVSKFEKLGPGFKVEFRNPEKQRVILQELEKAVSKGQTEEQKYHGR